MKRIYLATIAAAGALTLAACGSSGSSSKTSSNTPPPGGGTTAASSPASTDLPTEPGSVTVGSAAFQENELLADIYADAMAAQGVDVKKHVNIGERSLYLQALGDGSIGMVPEYSGSILYNLDTGASAKSSDDVFAALQDAAASNGYAVTQYSEAQDSDTISVTKQTADKYHLTSIGDLADVAGDLTLGAPAQFRTRADGVPALKSVYGVEFGNFTPTEAGGTVTINALKNGSIDAADIFSTDPAIPDNHLVPLEDPKNMFAAQNVVPLFSQDVLTQPMKDACDAVSAKLDTATLTTLVAKVYGGEAPDKVAKDWLAEVGLG
ncbi:MAG: osmoprotectant transport system substrate-binding protein [Pseudonocardiales bacterium]|jgi:osmoprotectant transport system substrate-binding protein|nr:osmoprotectant transport system substrate-binding protein [Pseudonocardiales bacterium]MDT4941500.1 osmoprotectant transport system substrate-binding protein [Pseudonocardiales bacterium]